MATNAFDVSILDSIPNRKTEIQVVMTLWQAMAGGLGTQAKGTHKFGFAPLNNTDEREIWPLCQSVAVYEGFPASAVSLEVVSDSIRTAAPRMDARGRTGR